MQKLIKYIVANKGFIVYICLRISIMALSLITNIFIIRKLTVNDYGTFSLALMFVGLVTTFGFSWSSSSILYYGGQEKVKTGSINKTFWSRNIIISVSLVIVTMLFLIFKTQINNYIGLNLTLFILLWLYVSVIEDYLVQYFLAVKQQLTSNLLSLTAKIIYLIFILNFSFDIKTLIIFNIISHSTVILYIFKMNKNDVGKFEFDKEWFKEIFNFSIWQLFGYSGLYLINFGDTAVISYFMTTEDVGIYSAAYKLFEAVSSFAFVISNYYAGSVTKYFMNKEFSNVKNFYFKERYIVFSLSTIAHVLVMLFSGIIISLMYGDRYTLAIPILNILMLGSIIRYWDVYYTLYYNTNKKYKLQQLVNIIRAMLNVVLNIIFVNIFGLVGVAIATTLSILLTTIFSFVYCEKRIRRLAYK